VFHTIIAKVQPPKAAVMQEFFVYLYFAIDVTSLSTTIVAQSNVMILSGV
jgi:hypothetical protein